MRGYRGIEGKCGGCEERGKFMRKNLGMGGKAKVEVWRVEVGECRGVVEVREELYGRWSSEQLIYFSRRLSPFF